MRSPQQLSTSACRQFRAELASRWHLVLHCSLTLCLPVPAGDLTCPLRRCHLPAMSWRLSLWTWIWEIWTCSGSKGLRRQAFCSRAWWASFLMSR